MKTYKIDDYIGKKVTERITVIGLDESYNKRNNHANHWIFECSCGNRFSESPSRVLSGHKQSCGCQRYKGCLTHGLNGDEFYHTWWSMMQRCYNPEHHNYKHYGTRGITVCEEWHDPKNFIDWARSTIGHKVKELTIDRKDNNGNYCPENCKWSTAKEQARNRRVTIYKTIDGETKPFTEWCEIYGIKEYVVRSRCNLGWSFEDAVKTPVYSHNPNSDLESRKGTRFMVEINGDSKSITDWCKEYGINRGMVYHRISRGMNPVEAITTPIKKKSRKST